ncbi:hypothetical protein ACJX0J_013601, partial [Zea mays]
LDYARLVCFDHILISYLTNVICIFFRYNFVILFSEKSYKLSAHTTRHVGGGVIYMGPLPLMMGHALQKPLPSAWDTRQRMS